MNGFLQFGEVLPAPIESIHITGSFGVNGDLLATMEVSTYGRIDSEFFNALFDWAKSRNICIHGYATPTKVIFNDPATIVLWSDGSKTVTKRKDGDEFNPLFGVMACAMRKLGRNRVRIDAWEGVLAFLADSVADADECRMLADTLNATADALELKGVMDELAKHDVRNREDAEPLFDGTDGTSGVTFVEPADAIDHEAANERLRATIRDLIDRGEL